MSFCGSAINLVWNTFETSKNVNINPYCADSTIPNLKESVSVVGEYKLAKLKPSAIFDTSA